jgi:hypothetical protein
MVGQGDKVAKVVPKQLDRAVRLREVPIRNFNHRNGGKKWNNG